MLRAICLFAVVICSIVLATTATVVQAERPTQQGRGISAQRQQRQQPTDGNTDEKELCDFCVDPCVLKAQLQKGQITDVDFRGEGEGRKIKKLWVIDARAGFHQPCAETDETYYVGSPLTKVYIINMNPFLFDYTITKTEDKVPESAQITFLKLLGTPLSDAIGSGGGTGASTSGGEKLLDDDCDAANAEKFLDETIDGKTFDVRMKELEDDYNKFQATYERVRSTYTSLLDPWATCQQLCRNANQYQKDFDNLPSARQFAAFALKVMDERDRLVTEFKARFPNIDECVGPKGTSLRRRLTRMRRQIDSLLEELWVLCHNLFKENREMLAKMDEAIDIVRRHPDLLLTQSFVVGGYSDATKVKISVEPKPKSEIPGRLANNFGTGPEPCAGDKGEQQEETPEQPVKEATPEPAPSLGTALRQSGRRQ